MTPPRVVCIGLATIDAIVVVDRLPGSDERVPGLDGCLAGGGVAATAAVTLARLEVPVAFIGRVADDEAGHWIRDDLVAAGVDVTGIGVVAGRSPLSAVLIERGGGGRALAPFTGDLPAIGLTEADLERCAAADWIHVDHVGYPALMALRAAGIDTPVSLDGGVPIAVLELDGVRLYAPTEAALLARHPGSLESAMRVAMDEGPSLVVATRGTAGSVGLERDPAGGPPIRAEAPPLADVTVASTLGAGDVFHGALLAALLDGQRLEPALRWANTVAGLSCRTLDGRSGIPDRPAVERALKTGHATDSEEPHARI